MYFVWDEFFEDDIERKLVSGFDIVVVVGDD